MQIVQKVSKLAAGIVFFFRKRWGNPFVVVMVDGGLGSQLNKYFVGEYIRKETGLDVKYDLSWYGRNPTCVNNTDTRNFDLLRIFPHLNFKTASKIDSFVFKMMRRFTRDSPFIFDEQLSKISDFAYVDGYCCHWKYIKDMQIDEVKFDLDLDAENQQTYQKIKSSSNSVALHIRRGDYVGSVHDVLNVDYFLHGLEEVDDRCSDTIQCFIFSNDQKWVRKNLIPLISDRFEVNVVEGNSNEQGVYDFFLISQCEHQVCSNSSFSYYAAFLNRNSSKIVIIPEKWMQDVEDGRYDGHSECFRLPDFIVV